MRRFQSSESVGFKLDNSTGMLSIATEAQAVVRPGVYAVTVVVSSKDADGASIEVPLEFWVGVVQNSSIYLLPLYASPTAPAGTAAFALTLSSTPLSLTVSPLRILE